MKDERQNRIEQLVRDYRIETQAELAERLEAEGFRVTQATVSRDIRRMNLIKRTDEAGRSYYALPEDIKSVGKEEGFRETYTRIFTEGCLQIRHAQNLLVIKTVSGMAMAVAAAMDAMHFPQIVGTIAGDDTVMCALPTTEEAVELECLLRGMVGKH